MASDIGRFIEDWARNFVGVAICGRCYGSKEEPTTATTNQLVCRWCRGAGVIPIMDRRPKLEDL